MLGHGTGLPVIISCGMRCVSLCVSVLYAIGDVSILLQTGDIHRKHTQSQCKHWLPCQLLKCRPQSKPLALPFGLSMVMVGELIVLLPSQELGSVCLSIVQPAWFPSWSLLQDKVCSVRVKEWAGL